jgi:hypothetical protein
VISRAIDYNTIFWPVQAVAKKDLEEPLRLCGHNMRPQRRNHEKQRLQLITPRCAPLSHSSSEGPQ